MRGDLILHARLVSRPRGIVGLVTMIAGGAAFASAYVPWYEVTASLSMLGDEGQRTVADLAGWEAHPWGWLVPTLSLVAVAAGAAQAVDRPWPPRIALGAGVGIALTVAVAGLRFPPVDRFDVAGSPLRDMVARSATLPSDIELAFGVRAAVGMWVALAGAALVIVATVMARDSLT